MNNNSFLSLFRRIYSVWYRHYRVYTRYLISNGLPPFLEPVLFFIAMGIGLGNFVGSINGIPYIRYIASAIIVPSAMYTASFECTFGTFIRMEFHNVYYGILSTPISVKELFVGELIFAGSKGMFFSTAVISVISAMGIIRHFGLLLIPLSGFLIGIMFGSLGLFITSFVKTSNHFSFYFSGLLTPMFLFSGIMFPIDRFPSSIRFLIEALPLIHSVRITRAICFSNFYANLWLDLLYSFVFTIIFAFLAIRRLERRLIL